MSAVWTHFTLVVSNNQFASCQHCGSKISRGREKSTSPLLKHLKTIHKIDLKNTKTNSSNAPISKFVSTVNKNAETGPQANPETSGASTSKEIQKGSTCEIADRVNGERNDQFSDSFDADDPEEVLSLGSVDLETDISQDSLFAAEQTTSPPPRSNSTDSETGTSQDLFFVKPSSENNAPPSKSNNKSKQPTISSYLDLKTKFKPGDYRAFRITNMIARMICIDGQPFSLVENNGFKALINHLEPRYSIPSRKFFSDKKLPEMYKQIKHRVMADLQNVSFVGVTTDMWTSVANQDYLALTVHFLDDNFKFKHLSVDAIPFTEISHSGIAIWSFLQPVLKDWHIESKVTAIVRDNGRNMVLALEMSKYPHVSCLAHTLQLVLKDGLLNSKLFTALTATSRRIVGHFKHSSGATKVLKKCQAEANLKPHRMVQDEPTRWNSTLHMLKRLKEQKKAILLAASEIENFPAELSSSQWALIENVIPILDIFDSATEQVSSANVSASEVIPLVTVIIKKLEMRAPVGSGLQGITNDLLASMKLRFKDLEKDKVLALACLLDPRFKDKPFRNQESQTIALNMLRTEVREVTEKQLHSEGSASTGATVIQAGSIWEEYEKLYQGSREDGDSRGEVERYIREPCEPPSSQVGDYWLHRSNFPALRILAKKYLCVPPSSVFSERLFSTAGFICDTKRNRLDPERVKMLVFLQKNLPTYY